MRIFEPLAAAGEASLEDLAQAAAYADGLARWRARDFMGAAECFMRFAHADPAAAAFLARAKALAAHPPGPDWEPVYRLGGKIGQGVRAGVASSRAGWRIFLPP